MNIIKNTIAASLLATLALSSISCTSTTPTTNSGSTTATTGTKPYPLTTCVVTDNDLGSMGDEQRIVYQGQEIKFCCKPCEAKFLKNPAKYLAKLGQ
jgi:hypothetical protein